MFLRRQQIHAVLEQTNTEVNNVDNQILVLGNCLQLLFEMVADLILRCQKHGERL